MLVFMEQRIYKKNSLFKDLMNYLEQPTTFSTSPKFIVIRFEFESVTSLDDCMNELVEQGNKN
jgi:hypothetical protein